MAVAVVVRIMLDEENPVRDVPLIVLRENMEAREGGLTPENEPGEQRE